MYYTILIFPLIGWLHIHSFVWFGSMQEKSITTVLISVRRQLKFDCTLQVIFLATSFATLYLMYVRFKATYDHNHDTFRIEFLLVPTVILSLLINHDYAPLEVSLSIDFVFVGTQQSISLVTLLHLGTCKPPGFVSCIWKWYPQLVLAWVMDTIGRTSYFTFRQRDFVWSVIRHDCLLNRINC